MSNLCVSFMASLVALSLSVIPASAQSMSSADLYFPTYGAAYHELQENEYLGTSGSLYDGVSFSSFVPGQVSTLTVLPTVGDLWWSGDLEYLSIWIDWDQSRVWEDAEEVVDLDDEWFEYGTNPLDFDVLVPSDAVLGSTWMRARFGFGEDMAASGFAYFGEVEDYLLDVSPVPEPTSLALLLCLGLVLGSGAAVHRQIRK